MFDTNAYLDRLHYTGSVSPNLDSLNALHVAHLMTIPYENLSIMAGEAFALDEEALFNKMIVRRRGGFCYELNILFARLLRELGFRVDIAAARIFKLDGGIGPNFDHMVLIVHLDEPWLVDVGNARWFHLPLRLNNLDSHRQYDHSYRLSSVEDVFVLHQTYPDKGELPQYLFTPTPRQGADFVPICHYKWKSPYSRFTQSRMCSRVTEAGRITLTDTSLVTITNGQRTERTVRDDVEFATLLHDCFDLGQDEANVELA